MNVLYATTNKHKVAAATAALQSFGVTLQALPAEIPDVHELQVDSQEAVARDKAHKYYAFLKKPLVVMDSGLFIEGLHGFPGIYTKYALETIGVEGLITLAKRIAHRTAYTERTIVFTDGTITKTFSYKCYGTILPEERGTDGRDYDFIFCVDATGKTLAEMTEADKADITGHAWREFGTWIKDYPHDN